MEMGLFGRREKDSLPDVVDDVRLFRRGYDPKIDDNFVPYYNRTFVVSAPGYSMREACERIVEKTRENGCEGLSALFSVTISSTGQNHSKTLFTVKGIPYVQRPKDNPVSDKGPETAA